MANPPHLQFSGLPNLGADDATATASPARGAPMLDFLQSRLNNRVPPLVHSWNFWHDRQDRSAVLTGSDTSQDTTTPSYEDRLEFLAQVSDVRDFWRVFNNFDVTQLKLRDSIHLFHRGIKPVWEDPRNARGGSWTFRVPKHQAAEFWQQVGMMAIGEQLQEAIEEPDKNTFRDDVCGISMSVRFNSMLVQIWNRDGDHETGIQRLVNKVLSEISEELKPREGSYYYKKHNEHAGFSGTEPALETKPATNLPILGQEMQSMDAVLRPS